MTVDKRVFQIDNECYIVYLGTDREDYKPFLRIGNSKRLTEKIISHVYNIVITDSYTGNPALEMENINRRTPKENRYVGTKQTVERFLKFLKNCVPETDKITKYQNGAVIEGGALVSFYDDGNIRLSYDKRIVFDLKNREKKDFHFIERTRILSDQLSRDTLRYRSVDFRQPGFCIIGGNTLVFNREKIIAVGLPDDYFTTLARSGIDPDLISGLVTEDASPAVLEFLKRKFYRKQQVSMLTMNPSLLESTLELFGPQTGGKLSYKLMDLRKQTRQTLHEYSISTVNGALMFDIKGLGFTLAISTADRKTDEGLFLLDPTRNMYTYKGRVKRIAEGIPCVFEQTAPLDSGITESYFSSIFDFFSGLLSQSEFAAAKQLAKFLHDIEHDTRFSAGFSDAKKGLKQAGRNPTPGFFFLLSNAQEICGMLKDKKANNPDACGALESIRARVLKTMGTYDNTADTVTMTPPVVCRLYISHETVVPLYFLARDSVTQDEYTVSKEERLSMTEGDEKAGEKYNEELALLYALMDRLDLPAPQEEEDGLETSEAAGTVPAGRMEIKAQKGSRPSGGKKDKKRIGVIIAAAAIVLAAILLVLFFVVPKRTADETVTTTEMADSAVGETETGTAEVAKLTEPTPPNLIRITILDIYLLTNRIARENGFRELDSLPEIGRDPDWIYPGNTFTLPDGTVYEVVDGDAIWYIAVRYIRQTLQADWVEYNKILKDIEKTAGAADDKEKHRAALEELKSGSYSENFRSEVDRTIREMGV